MKALTIYQPWASLIALGVKEIETRSWNTNYRGPLAIHAANRRRWPCEAFPMMKDGRVIDACHEAKNLTGMLGWESLWPRGMIVATCYLFDCKKISPWWDLYSYNQEKRVTEKISESIEGLVGDFTPGRYAWLLTDIQPLAEPIEAKGHQRLWEWNNGQV